MVTFQVDDVTPAAEALPTQPLVVPDALVQGGRPYVIEPNGVHPLLHAVGRAFADHRPLVLSPDAVWLTIAQGIARHIRLHAEELRSRLVEHAGRERLTVTVDGPMPRDGESWRYVTELFGKQLASAARATDLFECDFSTSTDVERMAGRIVMLDAYSSYFSYWMFCVCGIPSVTLTGTVEDWARIRERVDVLPDLGLDTWHRSLAPITDQFVLAAQGNPDIAFWQRIYNPVDAYGGAVITGWAARFYPYLKVNGEISWPNPLLELPIDEPRDITVGDTPFYDGPGIGSGSVPATLSRVIVNVNDGTDNRAVALHGGLVGVAQNGDGALAPVAGWHLAHAEVQIDDVVDRIVRDHVSTPPTSDAWLEGPADMVGLYSRIGSATLFGGTWRLRPVAEHVRVSGEPSITVIGDLPGGRCLGVANDYADACRWVVGRFDDGDPDLRVHGTSLAMLLEAALDGVDVDHLETARHLGL